MRAKIDRALVASILKKFTAALALLAGSASACALAGTDTFQNIGGLDADAYSTPFGGISGDGQVVVGFSRASTYNGNNRAWKWTASGGMSQLSTITVATAVSRDGSVIIGNGSGSGNGWRLAPTGNTPMPGSAYVVSPDGSIVLGVVSSTDQGWRWTSSGTTYIPPITNTYSPANAMTPDGSTIVGQARSATGNYIAYRWTAATGTVALTDGIGAASNSSGNAISDDGTLIAGFTLQQGSGVAAYWTAATGWKPMLNTGDFGSVRDLTPDGRFAVGDSGSKAFIWDTHNGLRYVKDLLTADGINLAGWSLTLATAISDDGQKIVGEAISPTGATTAWIATIPEPDSAAILASVAFAATLLRRRKTASSLPPPFDPRNQ